MDKDAADNKRPVQIRRILCNDKQTVKHVAEQQHQENGSEKPELLTDNRKDHIILSLGDDGKLLHAVAETLSEQTAGANGVQALQDLIAVRAQILLRVQPRQDTTHTEAAAGRHGIVDDYKTDNNGDYNSNAENEEFLRLWVRQEEDTDHDACYDNRCAQILREKISPKRLGAAEEQENEYCSPGIEVLPHTKNHIGHEEDDSDLGDLGRLELNAELQPSSGTVHGNAKWGEPDHSHENHC